MTDMPAPEITARIALYELLAGAATADGSTLPFPVDVEFGQPGGDRAPACIWVGGVETDEAVHGLRGDAGPSSRVQLTVNVHVDVEDQGATAIEVGQACLGLVGWIRATVRQAIRDRHPFGDGVTRPWVRRVVDDIGPIPLQQGGYVEAAVVQVSFVATI